MAELRHCRLDMKQRADADALIEAVIADPEKAAYEIIWSRLEIESVTGAMRADDERLALAAARVGIPGGCDAPEWMADEILRLRAELQKQR